MRQKGSRARSVCLLMCVIEMLDIVDTVRQMAETIPLLQSISERHDAVKLIGFSGRLDDA